MVKTASPAPAADLWSLFASALAGSRQGKVEEAKKDLKQVLSILDGESRIRLWAWKALREMGEHPPANVADEVHGVVCELHNEAGVGTMAAYSDGRARWLGGRGDGAIWEAPGSDAEISALIRDLLKSAEPLVKTAPVSDKHKTPEPKLNYFRVSILTYGGIHIVEVFGPEIDERHPVAPVLIASVNLLNALSKKSMNKTVKRARAKFNNALQLTASSLRSYVAPASSATDGGGSGCLERQESVRTQPPGSHLRSRNPTCPVYVSCRVGVVFHAWCTYGRSRARPIAARQIPQVSLKSPYSVGTASRENR